MSDFTFRICEPMYRRLTAHLFPGDGDEHGAVIAAGIARSKRGTRLLACELFLAEDGVDYVPGRHGYRALTPDFVARTSDYCARHGLCYFGVHCHGGTDQVRFSQTDLESHRRGYPALLDITHGGPVGALVFASNAVAGSIWTKRGVRDLKHMAIIGRNIQHLFPAPAEREVRPASIYQRQSLLFGAVGQERLAGAKIGIIGLGGAGSLINQWMAHVGVGHIVGVDFDKLEPTNRPRVVGSTPWDAQEFLRSCRWKPLQRLGAWFAKHKVTIAKRVAMRASPRVKFTAIVGDITDSDTAILMKDCDFIFLCADTAQSRLVFNALVHQYLVPGVQIGSKVPVKSGSGDVGDIFVVSRPILPYPRGGCLVCNGLIPSDRLQREALSEQERREQVYVDDPEVAAPSVITLNALACAPAANEFVLQYLGLFGERTQSGYSMQFCRERQWELVECRADPACLHCGDQESSAFAKGDKSQLPCKQ